MNKQEAVLYPSPYMSVLNKSSNSIVLAVNGKIKRLTCKIALLDDILSHIGPSAIFQDIVQAFVGTYPSSTLEHFLDLTGCCRTAPRGGYNPLLKAGADVVQCDKFTPGAVKRAVDLRDKITSNVALIASGGMTSSWPRRLWRAPPAPWA